jgi:DNA-binding PadR family transcriptional regulator
MFGRRQQRAERGDVRLLILDAIAEQPRHGYEIIQVIGERTGGNYQPSPGTVYPTLQMLEEMGQATSSEEEGRRVYAITEAGRAELEAHRDEVEDVYDRLGGAYEWFDMPELIDMFRHFGKMMRTLGRAFRRGWLEPQQLRDLKAIMDDAIERIQDVISGRGHRE